MMLKLKHELVVVPFIKIKGLHILTLISHLFVYSWLMIGILWITFFETHCLNEYSMSVSISIRLQICQNLKYH